MKSFCTNLGYIWKLSWLEFDRVSIFFSIYGFFLWSWIYIWFLWDAKTWRLLVIYMEDSKCDPLLNWEWLYGSFEWELARFPFRWKHISCFWEKVCSCCACRCLSVILTPSFAVCWRFFLWSIWAVTKSLWTLALGGALSPLCFFTFAEGCCIFVISLVMKIRSPWWIVWKKKMKTY
jgi:hypothetical protein